MVGKGYRRKDLTIGMGKANLFSILLFIPLFIVGYGAYYLVHGELGFSKFNFFGILMADTAGGDLMILHQLFSYKSDAGEVIYADHPTEAGLVVFERD